MPTATAQRRLAGGLALDVEQLHHLDHVQRRQHRAARAVGQRQRRAEQRHQPVAHHLVDHAAAPGDGVAAYQAFSSSMVSSGDCCSTIEVKPRMLLTLPRPTSPVATQRRPTAADPAPPRWRQANFTSAFCWAQALLFQAGVNARLEQHRVHRLGGSRRHPARCSAPRGRPSEPGDDHRQVAQLSVGDQVEHLEAGHLWHFHVQQVEGLGAATSPARCGRSRRWPRGGRASPGCARAAAG